ncbi:MAG: threonine synthase [Acidobacteria bacterium]|nr:threonine synthase [Acidobacteriota bacterium]
MRLVSTRDPKHRATFLEAVGRSLAPGGGLYLPDPVPCFADPDHLLEHLSPQARRKEILGRLLGDEMGLDDLGAISASAFDFPVSLVRVAPRCYALELFHGPTLAFKDFGARFLARVLAWLRARDGKDRTILTATSGDTGSAVASAFHGLPGFRAVVLYPKGRISELQERQFATLGGNVQALAVDGSFDDCQALAKAAFADAELSARLGLTSANSINIARLLAQVLYYWDGVALLRDAGIGDPPVFVVPSGNFGNLCAGVLAHRMGLPVRAFVIATNANTTVPDYLDGGAYSPRASVETLSNAMDVGAPNNWERISRLHGDDPSALRQAFRWGHLSDAETGFVLRELKGLGYQADPHAAVAYGVMRERLGITETGLFLGTAHPAKFADRLGPILGTEVELPAALAQAVAKPLLSKDLPNDFEALKAALG